MRMSRYNQISSQQEAIEEVACFVVVSHVVHSSVGTVRGIKQATRPIVLEIHVMFIN